MTDRTPVLTDDATLYALGEGGLNDWHARVYCKDHSREIAIAQGVATAVNSHDGLVAEVARMREALVLAEAILSNSSPIETTHDGKVPTINTRVVLQTVRAALSRIDTPAGDPIAKEDDGWRTIESAPKNGTPVDLWCRSAGLYAGNGMSRVPDCWFSGAHWWRYDEQYGDDQCRSRVHNATHWRPRPEPPRIATPEQKDGE